MIRKTGKGSNLVTISNSKVSSNKTFMYTFDSISEFVDYINSHKRVTSSKSSDSSNSGWSGTRSLKDALELLENGWEDGAKKIDKGLKELQKTSINTSFRQRSVYDVIGGNASVPRYLQGVPTNMIRQVRQPVKQPVVNINFSFSFPNYYSQQDIIDECIKTLQKVSDLENSGTRVNLYAVRIASTEDTTAVLKVCVKKSTERLNILKLAFPVAHPSMLRRLALAFDEMNSDLPQSWYIGYGMACPYDKNEAAVEAALKGGEE